MLQLSVIAATCLAISWSYVFAQGQVVDYTETTLASVIFLRTGDHTPMFLGTDSIKLTTTGARQLYDAGSFFRSRYILNTDNATVSSTTAAPIAGLATDIVDNDQLFFLADEDNLMLVGAQAFAQGLYPPTPLGSNDTSALSDTSAILANNSFISGPLSNFQYVAIGSTNGNDPTSVITSGNNNCPAWEYAADSYGNSSEFTNLNQSTLSLYDIVGSEFLDGILDIPDWSYTNAYEIYDYISYLANHNNSAAAKLNSTTFNSQPILTQLRSLASELLWKTNTYDTTQSQGTNGSFPSPILSISGATVAMSVLDIFSETVATQGAGEQLLSVFVTDFQPFLGFASASQLSDQNPAFQGLPGYGAAMVWELYSVTNSSQGNFSSFPSTDDLWVRFLFRNGSDDLSSDGSDLISYPLFNRDPDETEMSWNDFESLMAGVATDSVDDWCSRCDAQTLFCIGINSLASGSTTSASKMSNAVAGVTGAFVTLAVIATLLLLLIVFGGLRFHTGPTRFIAPLGRRNRGARANSASNPNSNHPAPGSAPPDDNKHESFQSAITAVNDRAGDMGPRGISGHTKGESWEMTSVRRVSLDDDDRDKVDELGKPVEARETV